MSNILIIGNGFDIYHGLPTRYDDFLYLANHWIVFYEKYLTAQNSGKKNEKIEICLKNGKLCMEAFDEYVQHKNIFYDDHIQYLNEHIVSNSWINHFLKVKLK